MACSNLKTDMADKPEFQEYLKRLTMIYDEINRIIDLLNGYLSQARHKPGPLTEVNINSINTDLLALVKYQIPELIKLHYQPSDDIIYHLPDSLFQQALLKLILNARQAISDKAGLIQIEVEHETSTLLIHITDNGPGFPPEILENNIRSFSSHRTGGTGLGLAMVNRFAHNHNGQLLLSNLSPKGARVTLKLACNT